MSEPFTIIDEVRAATVDAAIEGGRILVPSEDIDRALGWTLKPEGFCRDDVCVPVRDGSNVLRNGAVDLAAFAELIGRPIALDAGERAAAVGASAQDRTAVLTTGEAPDFTLPDLSGRMHSLSDYRSKKVFLAVWASW
jgi:hypothetical protein